MFRYLLRVIIVSLVLMLFLIGIDKEPYYEEGSMPWRPVLFIEHSMSFRILFEIPISPAEAVRYSLLTPNKSRSLTDYCKIRYGDELTECRKKLARKMINNGFYIPN